MKTEGGGNASIFDVEVHAAVFKAAGAATACGNAIIEAAQAASAAGGRDDLVKQLEKLTEFNRLMRGRLAATLQLLERAP